MELLTHPWQLGLACFAAGFLLARWVYFRHGVETGPIRIDISEAEIEAAVQAGRKVDAIRLYRQRSGAGLKQALRAIDAMKRGNPDSSAQ